MKCSKRLVQDGDVRVVTRLCIFPRFCYTDNEDGSSQRHCRWMETAKIEQRYETGWDTSEWTNVRFID